MTTSNVGVRRRATIVTLFVMFLSSVGAVVLGQDGLFRPEDELRQLRAVVEYQAEQLQRMQQQLAELAGSYAVASASLNQQPPASNVDSSDGFTEVGSDLTMTGQWRHGLQMETKDKAFRIHPTGRLQFDTVWIDGEDQVEFGPNGIGDTLDAVAFRRFRVGVEGTFWEVCNFHFQPDLLNTVNSLAPNGTLQTTTVVVPIDNWVEITHLPLIGNIRIGSVKPEYAVEHLTSSNNLDFMERSLIFDAFVGGLDNGFQPGAVVYNTFLDDRLRLATSITKNTQNIFGFNQGEGEWNWVVRVSGLPIDAFDGRCLVHLGCSYSHKDLDEDQFRFRARTTLRNGPAARHTALADLTVFGDRMDMVIPELVVIAGPWSVVAEYAGVWTDNVDRANLGFGVGTITFPSNTLFFQGFHIDVMYFLTQEHRPYDRRMGFLGQPIPLENFFMVRDENNRIISGRGAWQVGVRYSQVDFTDSGVPGGLVRDVTLGVNWYLNPNLKFQWNFTINEREIPGLASNGFVYGAGMRTALQF